MPFDPTRPPANERPFYAGGHPESFLFGTGLDGAPARTLVLGQPATVIGVNKKILANPFPSFVANAPAGFLVAGVTYGGLVIPQEQGFLQASSPDQTSRLYTVTIGKRNIYGSMYGSQNGRSLRAHVLWGAGQVTTEMWIDATVGTVFSVAGSTVQVSVASMFGVGRNNVPAGALAIPDEVGVFIGEGQRTITKPLRLTETYYWPANLVPNYNFQVVVIPPFATDVIINRRDYNAGTNFPPAQAYSWNVADEGGNPLFSQAVAAGVDMTAPILLPANVTALIYFANLAGAAQVFTISWGLTV